MKPVLATPSVVVPEPIFVTEETAPRAVAVRVVLPAPTKLRACAPLMPPVRLRVAPPSAPMKVAAARVIAPLSMTPAPVACSAPADWMPPPVRLRGSAMDMPAGRRRAAPLALTTVLPAVVPSAPASRTFTAPWAMVRTPVHEGLAALSASVPESALVRPAVGAAATSKAELSWRVLLPVTSIARVFAAVVNWIVGPTMLLVTRSVEVPVEGFRLILAPPILARLPMERTPWVTVIGVLNALPALLRTSVPAPALVKPVAAVMAPEISRPWMTFDAVALATV